MGRLAPRMIGMLLALGLAPAAMAHERPISDVPYPVETIVGAYLAGGVAERVNDARASARYMNRVLAADPANPGLLRRALQAALLAGDFPTAASHTASLSTMQQSLGLIEQLVQATEALDAGDSGRAGEIAAGIGGGGLGGLTAPFLAAWSAVGDGDAEAALAALEPIRSRPGLTALAALHAALIHDALGNPEAARTAYDAAVAEFASLRIIQLAGNALERQGQIDAALALYRSFAADNPASTLIGPDLDRLERGEVATAPIVAGAADGLAEAFYQLGRVLNQESTQEPALAFARLALALKADFPMAKYLLGDILYMRGRYDRAIVAYQSIPADHSAHWSAMLQAADAMREAERVPEAMALLEDLAEREPGRMEPLIRIGDLHRLERDFEAAAQAYDAAYAREPARAASDWTFLYRRGIALERSSDWHRAEADFLAAIEINPEHAHLLNYLGYSWIDRNENLERGEELIRQALTLAPDDGYIIDSLGWAYYRTGRMEEAVRELERAVEFLPDDPTINDHLGDAYWQVGRRVEARFQWQRALREADETDMIEAIEHKLEHGLVETGAPAAPVAERNGS